MEAYGAILQNQPTFGGGEWFTRVNKRSQKMVLYTYDAYSSQTPKILRDDP